MPEKLTANHPARRVFRYVESHSRSDGSINTASSEGRFNELALELFAFQFEHNEAYRKFCELRNCKPGSIDQWREIPTVPTTAFKEFELSCLPVETRSHVFHSSGTTAQKPSRHFHSIASLEVYNASLKPWLRRHVMPKLPDNGANLLSLTPAPFAAVHSSLAHMLGVVISELGNGKSAFVGSIGKDASWEIDGAAACAQLNAWTKRDEPVVLLGTAFNFVHLLDHLIAEQQTIELPAGSTVMETGGYKGRSRELPKAELHKLISKHLGVAPGNIVCEYGMSELSSQAYDRIAGDSTTDRVFHFPPWARSRVVSPETGCEVATGETGLIQVFDLANAFSVMAIQTEDLAIRRENGFELIGRAGASEPRGCSLMAV
jgi:hypothetical protein